MRCQHATCASNQAHPLIAALNNPTQQSCVVRLPLPLYDCDAWSCGLFASYVCNGNYAFARASNACDVVEQIAKPDVKARMTVRLAGAFPPATRRLRPTRQDCLRVGRVREQRDVSLHHNVAVRCRR